MAGRISGRTSRGPKVDPAGRVERWDLVPVDGKALEARPSDQKLQELWLVLAQRDWTSLAIVPAHGRGSAADIACSLADTGSNLTDYPVSAVTVNELGPGSARALASLANDSRGRNGRWPVEPFIDVTPGQTVDAAGDAPLPIVVPPGQLVIGVPSVVAEPVSLTVVQAVDLVVLAVELGVTRVREIKRSIELIGRERLVGCILY